MSYAIKSLLLSALLLSCADSSFGAAVDQQTIATPTHAAVSLDASLLSSVSAFGITHRDSLPAPDSTNRMLSVVLGASLIALQLRRRQKSLRNPRLLT